MPTLREIFNLAEKGRFDSSGSQVSNTTTKSDIANAVDALDQRTVVVGSKDPAAGTDSVLPLLVTTKKIKILSCRISTAAAVSAGNATDHCNTTLRYNDDNGGTATNVSNANLSTSAAGYTAGVSRAISLDVANVVVDGSAARKSVYLNHDKVSAGTDLATYTVTLEYQEI